MSLVALLFLLGFVGGCLLAFIRHPIYGLITYIGVFYLHPPSRWWGQGVFLEVRWMFVAAAVTFLALMIRKRKVPVAPVFRSGVFWGLVVFIAWLGLQSFWALDAEAHSELLLIYVKFAVAMVMICKCIESENHLRLFLWAHVLGCFYLGWLAFTTYMGGRFEEFGGPGLNEANAAALQLVTGIVVAGVLFLAGRWPTKAALLGIIPVIVNALVATISRSGFLAAGVAGLIVNFFAPKKYRLRIRVLSVLALLLFAVLTNAIYWERMGTIAQSGQEIHGVDTGSGRLEIIEAQWRMFKGYPLGCGHMCTTVLSPGFLEEKYLSEGARASHNTFMTMLVDHGIPGAIFYMALIWWAYRNLRIVIRRVHGEEGFLATVLPAIAGVIGAIFVADQFVQYPKFEARIWFVSLVIVLLHLSAQNKRGESTV